MTKKVDLKLVQGRRDSLEKEIVTALFTEFDGSVLDMKIQYINEKLQPKTGLRLVSDQSQKPQDER